MSTSSVNNVTSNSAISSATSTTGTSNDELNYKTFISLLATELQNQDPTDPVDSTEYVSQMAQLSMLSQMSGISTAVDTGEATDLIGKIVGYTTTDSSGDTVTGAGTVQSIYVSGSSVYVVLDDSSKILLSDVNQIADGAASSDASSSV